MTLTVKKAPKTFSTDTPVKYVPQTFKKFSTVTPDGLSTFKKETKSKIATNASVNRNHKRAKK